MAMLQVEELPALVEEYQRRYSDRDERHRVIHEVISGQWEVSDLNEDPIEKASANLIQVASEDTGDSAAVMPSIRVKPWKNTERVKRQAVKQEMIAQHYSSFSKVDHMLSPTVQSLANFGISPWIVWPDFDEMVPVIERRTGRGCYPEPGIRTNQNARNVVFMREVPFNALKREQQAMIISQVGFAADEAWRRQAKVLLTEYFDETQILIGGIITTGGTLWTSSASSYKPAIPVHLGWVPHELGVCPVVVGERFTEDSEQRGQFDQVVGPQRSWARLQALALDYADQLVYSDIWTKDVIGEISYGGGSYINLGPNGGIGRVPPASSSFQVNNDLALAEEAVHTGGRWPKSRPGQIDQSIASAKFLESSNGMMNTVIKGYHMVLKSMIESTVQIAFATDLKVLGPREDGPRLASGILRNQEFAEDYNVEDIDLKNRVMVDYGLGLGKDPSQSAVLQIQYAQNGYISEEFVQESIEGVTNVARERARIDSQKLRQVLFGKLIESVQAGQVTNRQLLELARKRYEGDDLLELFEEYVVVPEEEMLGLPTSGLTGQPIGGPPGVAPPGQPGAQPGVPPAPNPSDLLARINTPAGPGGTLGAQTINEGAPV